MHAACTPQGKPVLLCRPCTLLLFTQLPFISKQLHELVTVVPAHDDGAHHLGGLHDACMAARGGRGGIEPSGQFARGVCSITYCANLCLLRAPVKIRPRMETLPVKGHFLST
eukprot:818436-Pelagomonas_calceolata.AAC.4